MFLSKNIAKFLYACVLMCMCVCVWIACLMKYAVYFRNIHLLTDLQKYGQSLFVKIILIG